LGLSPGFSCFLQIDMASPAQAVPGSKSMFHKRRIRQSFFSRTLPFWLLLPSLLVLAAIQFYPAVYSFFLSTQDYVAGKQIYNGTRNFERVFNSSTFGESVYLTFFFLIGYVILTLVTAFVVALFLNRKLRFSPLYLTLIFIPWVLSDVIVGLIFRLFIVPDYGLLSPIFASPFFGEPNGISILTTPQPLPIIPGVPFPPAPALLLLIFASAWKAVPFTTLLILAALQTVSREVLESASIDGANGFSSFRFITFPLVLPTMVVALFNLSLTGINGVGMIFSLTGGGPGTATETLSFLLYTIGFGQLEFGRAAALSVFMAIINLGLILLALRVSRTETEHV
jgi:multiple sugar transport system permease protein